MSLDIYNINISIEPCYKTIYTNPIKDNVRLQKLNEILIKQMEAISTNCKYKIFDKIKDLIDKYDELYKKSNLQEVYIDFQKVLLDDIKTKNAQLNELMSKNRDEIINLKAQLEKNKVSIIEWKKRYIDLEKKINRLTYKIDNKINIIRKLFKFLKNK